MAGLLEQTRVLHADVERCQAEAAQELQVKCTNHRHLIHHDHFVSERLTEAQSKNKMLLDLYKSDEMLEQGEVGGVETSKRAVSSFYTRLAELREYHKRFPDGATAGVEKTVLARPTYDEAPKHFSGEENYGKYLDLHALHSEYLNLDLAKDKKEKPAAGTSSNPFANAQAKADLSYDDYLSGLVQFESISHKAKHESYKKYLQKLADYLADFLSRTQPLADVRPILDKAKEHFEESWAASAVEGWQSAAGNVAIPKDGQTGLTKSQRRLQFWKGVALLEVTCKKYVSLLGDTLQNTIEYLERKSTRTTDEVQAEVDAEDAEAEAAFEAAYGAKAKEEEVEEDFAPKVNENLLKFPIGWDGKPIPAWLYKLHGLNVTYECEICGNMRYKGPRSFERHFQETKHAHGMRTLKIPNTQHFHGVTKIRDALALWEKIKYEGSLKVWQPENEQEYEDQDGALLPRKTYEMMKRQGLL